MKKFILAAVLALPLTALGTQRAAAWGDCGNCCNDCQCCCATPTITANFGFKFKAWGCLKAACDHVAFAPVCTCPCNNCCGCPPCGGGCNQSGGGGGYAAPWYSYWPFDAHFMTPAPTGYPGYPSQMGPMMNGGGGPPCVYGAPVMNPSMYNQPAMAMYGYGPPPPSYALPAPAPTPYTPASVQPCGYTPSQVPSYWYGR